MNPCTFYGVHVRKFLFDCLIVVEISGLGAKDEIMSFAINGDTIFV